MINVALLGDCGEIQPEFILSHCHEFAWKELETLDRPQYSRGVSVAQPGQELGRTFRKRALKGKSLGYSAQRVVNRSLYYPSMCSINRSLPERQGRPMDKAYTELAEESATDLPFGPCAEHEVAWYGVFLGETYHQLVGYATIYHCGELTHISQFLVHGDHLENHAAYVLMRHIMTQAAQPGIVFYNRHDSGTDGLRFFKERCGFHSEDVRWTL